MEIWKAEPEEGGSQESDWLLTFNVPVMHIRFMSSNDIISIK
jgi:hypothetical protein